VPYAGYDYQLYALEKKRQIVQLNNAFWLCHRAFRSNANVVHGAAYDIPEGIGLVDISTFGAVLLHIRDPFRALQKALRLTREAVIVTEPLWQRPLPQRILARLVSRRFLGSDIVFVPDFRRREPKDAWWVLSPDTIRRFIGVLGFENTKVIYHSQSFRTLGNQARIPCYTVVGYRTIDALA
jgi:hypothetical protein